MVDELSEASDAVERGEWRRALELLDQIGDHVEQRRALELRAAASYGAGRFEASVAAWEEFHALALAEGDEAEAARGAAMVGLYLMIDTGLMSPVRGWLRTAERLAGDEEGPAHAVVAMVRTYERFMCGDMATARSQAQRSIELGERLDVLPAVVIGRTASARVAILDGEVDRGLDELDEVGALLMSGQVDPLTTGMMLCELVCAARSLAMHDRAAEWTDVMERWRQEDAFGGLHGRCRVHRAEMLRVAGPSDRAEAEALRACDELRPWMRREFGWPLAELGNIRLRRGDLDGAEEAFVAAHEHAWCPHPGLALVKLARGETAAATALIDQAIRHPLRVPSKERPPSGELYLAPLLEAQVTIACAADDRTTAQSATERLAAVADTFHRSPHLRAAAALAAARTALLDDDHDTAVARCGEAIADWSQLGAPFEAATARVVLAEAHDRAGEHDLAAIEWHAATNAFEAFGAPTHAADALAHIGAGASATGSGSSSPTHRGEFRLAAGSRRIVFAGRELSIRDLKGYRYLERLLADPHREFHVLDLVNVDGGSLPTGAAADHDADVRRGDPGLPILDEEARDAYRRRLAEVEEDLEEARAANDLGRMELAQRDHDFLVAELSRGLGLGGQLRSTGSDAEKARGSVGRCLRYALEELDDQLPELADHLDASLRTGTYCTYDPDPLVVVDWETGPA